MNTFDAWKEATERNKEVDRVNAKRNSKSILIKALLLSPFILVALGFLLIFAPDEGLASDGSNMLAIAFSIALVFLIPILFGVIITVTPSFFKRETREEITPLRNAWAKVHGLDPAGDLPDMYSYLYGVKEQVFTQRVDSILKTYRLVNEDGAGILYDAEGNRVDSKASAVNTAGGSFRDPNSELWKTASKTISEEK